MKTNIQKITNHKKEIAYIIICMIVIALFLISNIEKLNQTVILNDEFGYWSIAASFAGKNWTQLIENTPYYAYGYSFLLVPFFLLGFTMSQLYKIAVVMNGLMLLASFLITIYCGRILLPKINKYLLITISFVIGFYPNTVVQSQIAWTETLLYFLFWCSIMLLIHIINTQRIWSVLLYSIVLGYMFMVHQRTLGILIAGVITIILLGATKKLSKKQLFAALSVIFILIVLQVLLKEAIKAELWSGASLGEMNDFSGQKSNLEMLFSAEGIKNLILGVCGRYYYFAIVGLSIWFLGMWNMVSEVIKAFHKKSSLSQILDSIPVVKTFVLLSFFASVGIGCIFMIGKFWRLDLIVYGRYIENVVGPILLFGFGAIFTEEKRIKKLIIYFGTTILGGMIVADVLSKIDSNLFNNVSSVGLAMFFQQNDKILAVYKATVYSLLILSILFLLLNLKWRKIGNILICVVIVISWFPLSNTVLKNTIYNMQENKTDQYENLSYILNESGIREVYYIRDKNYDSYCTNVKYLQYWMPDIVINIFDYQDATIAELDSDSVWICENGSPNMSEWTRDAYAIGRNNSLSIYVHMNSNILKEMRKKDLISLESVKWWQYSSNEIWDENYPEDFYTNGNAGQLINDSKVFLSTGSYRVDYRIELIDAAGKEKLGKIFVAKNDGKDIIQEMEIDQDYFNQEIQSIVFSCKDTAGIEFNVEVEDGVIIRLDSITYDKISNDYVVGSDCKKDLLEVVEVMRENTTELPLYYASEHKNVKFDFSYLNEWFQVDATTNEEVKKGIQGDSYVLLEERGVDLFDYVEKYDILMKNGSYVLLTNKGNGIAFSREENGKMVYNKGNAIDSRILQMNSDGTFYVSSNISLNQGTYESVIRYKTSSSENDVIISVGGEETRYAVEGLSQQKELKLKFSIKNDGELLYKSINSKTPIHEEEIFIERVNTAYEYNLADSAVKKGTYEKETGSIVSTGNASSLYESIPENIAMGTYKIKYFMSLIENKDNTKIGKIKIVADENIIIGAENILFDMFKDGKAQVELTIEVPKDGMVSVRHNLKTSKDIILKLDKVQLEKIN